jgi:hypothetical protein
LDEDLVKIKSNENQESGRKEFFPSVGDFHNSAKNKSNSTIFFKKRFSKIIATLLLTFDIKFPLSGHQISEASVSASPNYNVGSNLRANVSCILQFGK